MPNATDYETIFAVHMVVGLVPAGMVLGVATTRLFRIMKDKRNGQVRLLARERMATSVILTASLLVGSYLSLLLVAAPPVGTVPTGPVETWARETLQTQGLPLTMVMVCSWPYLALWKWYVNWRLDQYDREETKRLHEEAIAGSVADPVHTESYNPHRRHSD